MPGLYDDGYYDDLALTFDGDSYVAPATVRFRGTLQEALEFATAMCCCPGEGSGSGPSGRPIGCCPGILLPNVIQATMHSVALNGTFALTYSDTGGPFPFESDGPGWYSAAIPQFNCAVGFSIFTYTSYLKFHYIVNTSTCFFVWRQQAIPVGPGIHGATGSAADACFLSPLVCDPLYFHAGLQSGTGPGGMPYKDCFTNEPEHDCVSSGASVEVTL